MADIQAMFHQVRVPEEDRNALLFLWWDNEKLEGPPLEHRMCVHLFGAKSSPSCAAFGLNRAILDKGKAYYVDVMEEAKQCFYVDDCLYSTRTIDEARTYAGQLKSMLEDGGFNLSKWVSNDLRVLKLLPESDCAVDCVQLSLNEPSIHRTLGLNWNLKEDSYRFHVQPVTSLSTRRNILSYVSSFFDSLGYLSPVILTAKLLLQRLCKLKFEWDEIIEGVELDLWSKWSRSIQLIQNLLRPVAWWLKYRTYLVKKNEQQNTSLAVNDLRVATKEVIRLIQSQTFSKEISSLQNTYPVADTVTTHGPKKDKVVCRSSSLRKLNPLLFDGILRVGGRLQDATLPFETTYPVILPLKRFVTHLITEHYHTLNGHAGLNFVVSNLRQKYWILKAAKTEQPLTDAFLCTTIVEIELMLNDRPLVKRFDDPDDQYVLSPNKFLLLRSNESVSVPEELPCWKFNRRWRQAQNLPGDLVLVVNKGTSRGQWSKAVIENIVEGSDGLVLEAIIRTAAGHVR
ncbi:hypothetical protein X801_01571, partial [Opisthorchis viverrini]